MAKSNTLRISISDLVYFSSCRRKWLWDKFYETLYPIPAFFVGRAVHDGLEALYKKEGTPRKALNAAKRTIKRVLTQVSENPVEFGGEEANLQYEDLAILIKEMVKNYTEFDEEESLLKGGSVEHVELKMKQILATPGWDYNSITLVGRADLIIKDRNGDLWVVDHKTTSTYTPGMAGLDVDEQLTGYMYLCWKKLGIVPKGVIYNVLIKKVPAEPRRLKSGALSQDKSQPTTYNLYMDAIKADKLDEDDYDEMLSLLHAKGWSGYFFREEASRNEAELQSFENRMVTKATDIASIYQDPKTWAYPSPMTRECNYCGYLSACKSAEDGGDPESILKVRFRERRR